MMNDYDRIARVITYLEAHRTEQPTLSELASVADLSDSHFHRLFTRWAGVTPKAFLQCLTHTHACSLLKDGENVLNSALDCGLSGPGRLHDLCVTLVAASPGEIQSGGAGIEIRAGFTESPFGRVLIAECDRGICHLRFVDHSDEEAYLLLEQEWPNARITKSPETARHRSAQIFTDHANRKGLSAFVQGSVFQLKVWNALLQIPEGQLVSYGQLAHAIGDSRASRAVGTAIGKNPIAYLIPCHRVIRQTGVLGGYRWDPRRKQAMIARESAGRFPS